MDLERVAYDAALRSLDRQEQLLNELRARTGILVAAASLAVPFLARPALEDANLPLLLAGLASFACWDSNNVRLKRVVVAFRVAAITLGAEVALLLASVGATLV